MTTVIIIWTRIAKSQKSKPILMIYDHGLIAQSLKGIVIVHPALI